MAVPPARSSPRDAQVMSAILKDMGVTEHEPRLINQMLEFTYRYVTDILDDAKVYSNHANKKAVDVEDVQLAVQCRMDHSFTSPPPRDLLMEIARHKNGQSLPLIKPYTGPRLPPDRYCLTASNYKLVSNRKKAHRIQIGLPVNPLGGGHRISLTPLPKHSNKVQITTPTARPPGMSLNSMTVINRPPTVKPMVRVATQGAPALLTSGPNTHLGGIPQMSGTPIMGGAPSHSPASQNMTGSQPIVSVPGIVTPQKRKHEDDDYDQT